MEISPDVYSPDCDWMSREFMHPEWESIHAVVQNRQVNTHVSRSEAEVKRPQVDEIVPN